MTQTRNPAQQPQAPRKTVDNVFPVYFTREKTPAPVVRELDALEQHFAYYDAA